MQRIAIFLWLFAQVRDCVHATELLSGETNTNSTSLPLSWKLKAKAAAQECALVMARSYLACWQTAWKNADQFELHSITLKKSAGLPVMYEHYAIIGTAVIKEPGELAKLYPVLACLIYEGQNPDQPRPGCFQPHHALTIVTGRERHDLIICFSCDASEAISPSLPQGHQRMQPLTETQERMVDSILSNHKIRLAKKFEAELEEAAAQQAILLLKDNPAR